MRKADHECQSQPEGKSKAHKSKGWTGAHGKPPTERSVASDDTATLQSSGHGQRIGVGIGGFDGTMVMAMPAAASEPQTQRVIEGRVPRELQRVPIEVVFDSRSSLANRTRESLG